MSDRLVNGKKSPPNVVMKEGSRADPHPPIHGRNSRDVILYGIRTFYPFEHKLDICTYNFICDITKALTMLHQEHYKLTHDRMIISVCARPQRQVLTGLSPTEPGLNTFPCKEFKRMN